MINKNIDIRDACFEEVYKIMEKDKNVIFLSDDMDAFVLQKIKMEFPKQYINVGVAEQNLMDLAAGLATCGKKVFVYGICSYITGRCFEQIKFSIASMKLPIVIIGIGAGFSFPFDGPTHHGTGDIAIMKTVPEMSIINPCDTNSSRAGVKFAHKSKLPAYIRLDKGTFPQIYQHTGEFANGLKIIKPVKKTTVISTGYMTHLAIKVYEKISDLKIKIGVVDVVRIKPVNESGLKSIINKCHRIITLEENLKIGGLGAEVLGLIAKYNMKKNVISLGVNNHQFFDYGSRDYLLRKNGLDVKTVSNLALRES